MSYPISIQNTSLIHLHLVTFLYHIVQQQIPINISTNFTYPQSSILKNFYDATAEGHDRVKISESNHRLTHHRSI